MRLIDADALINRIVFHSDLPGDQKEVFEDEINAEQPVQPEQRWIPCSERLPDEKDAGILKKLGTEKNVRVCPCHSGGQGRKNDRDSLYV